MPSFFGACDLWDTLLWNLFLFLKDSMPRGKKKEKGLLSGKMLNRKHIVKGCSFSALQIRQLYQLFKTRQSRSSFTRTGNWMDL